MNRSKIGNLISKALTAAIAAVMVLAPSPISDSGCPCGDDSLEIVFVIDSTGSMQDSLATVKAQIVKILSVVELYVGDVRVGAVAFRTSSGPNFSTRRYPLTSDHKQFAEELRKLKTRGGGDENVDEAMQMAVHKMNWSKGARKLIVIMGDESQNIERETRMIATAHAAKRRGIVVHGITPSQSAWSLYGSWKKNVDPKGYEKLVAGRTREELHRSFTLPGFDRMAEITGGRSVPMSGARDAVRGILIFALGRTTARAIDADKLLDMKDPGGKDAGTEQKTGKALIGRLRFRGNWNSPISPDALLSHLKKTIRLDYTRGARVVNATDDLSDFPVLYLSARGPFKGLGERGQEAVRAYLDRGGLLVAAACCGSKEFDTAFRRWVKELYPEAAIEKLPADHALFKAGYALKTLRYRKRPRVPEFEKRPPVVYGVSVKDRLRVVYVPHSLGFTWRTRPFEPPCAIHDEDGRRLTTNIILYALQ